MPDFTAEELSRSYEVLELSPGASLEEIREAYRDLIRIWHPDRYHGESDRILRKAEDKFRELTEAYRLLQGAASEVHAEQPPGMELTVRTPAPTVESAGTGAGVEPNCDLRPIRFGEQYGYVSHSGRLVISPAYEFADNFYEGLARVQSKGQYGFINSAGQFVILPVFEGAGKFSEGLAVVKHSGRFGYVDPAGKVVIAPQFESASAFQEGRAVVSFNKRYGYINHEGVLIIPALYEVAESFTKGRARVRLADKWGRLNKAGEFFLESR